MKFIDGFSQKRVFCRGCSGSFLEFPVLAFGDQKKLGDFNNSHYNTKAIIKHF